MLGGIKNIKMLGMQGVVETQILNLREHELEMAAKVRWMMLAYNASSKLFYC